MKQLFFILSLFFIFVLQAERIELVHRQNAGWRDFAPIDYRMKNFTMFEVKQQYGYVRWRFIPNKQLSGETIAYPCKVDFIPGKVIFAVKNNLTFVRLRAKLEGADGKQFFSTPYRLPSYMMEQGIFPWNIREFENISALKLPIRKIWLLVDSLNPNGEYDIELASIILER